jgi:electron transfer flavoprotein alpha subunit
MSGDILVITECLDGKVSDISYEMIGKANELAGALGGQVIAVSMGSGMIEPAGTFASDATIYVDAPMLAHFNPEAYGKVVESLVAEKAPRITMFGSTSMGMDLAAWLSVRSGQPLVAYVNGLAVEGDDLVATSQVYAGKMEAECVPEGESVIVTVLAGAFPADAGQGTTTAEQVVTPASLASLKTRFVELIMPEAGDIDISAQEKLVAIGRGIGSEDNVVPVGYQKRARLASQDLL